ncbi:MAG: thermonuclease family protein [Thermoleophilia bacterium]
MRTTRITLAAAAVALVAGCGSSGGPAAVAPGAEPARVDRVVDGDTLIAVVDGARERVRLLGVDAPESVTPDRPVECGGPAAAAAARRLMPEGAAIALATDPTQGRDDQYGRRLAEVTVAGAATTVNEQLVEEGAAEVFRGDGRARLLPALRAAERRAREARRGLWGSCRRR